MMGALYAPLEPPLILFFHVMNLWRLTRPDCIPLAPLASDFYWSLANGRHYQETGVSGERD